MFHLRLVESMDVAPENVEGGLQLLLNFSLLTCLG